MCKRKPIKIRITTLLIFFFLLHSTLVISQEWKNLKSYQKETGNLSLQEGCWLTKDRRHKDEVWNKANLYNLGLEKGNVKYKTISQIRDFYVWFDGQTQKQGHEIKWIGIAATVSAQLSKLDCSFIRIFIVRNKEVVAFSNEGSRKVFEFAYPQLQKVYFSNEILKGAAATAWDTDYGTKEQCAILEPLYEKLSPKALHKIDCMAKGKGIFALAVPNRLKFKGSIEDCQARFEHGMYRIYAFSMRGKEDKKNATD